MRYSDTDRAYDALLVMLVQSGDRKAANRLAVRWYPRLLITARRLLRDEDQSRDAVQECWLGICRGLPRLRDSERFPAWAFGILHRKCADRIRSQQKQRRLVPDTDENLCQHSDPKRNDDLISIDQALAALSQDQHSVFILYFTQGLRVADIAQALKIPEGTVKSRLFHARRIVKSHIQGDPS